MPALEEMTGNPFCAPWNRGKVLERTNRQYRIVCKECPELVFGSVRKGKYSRITERRCDGLQWILKRI